MLLIPCLCSQGSAWFTQTTSFVGRGEGLRVLREGGRGFFLGWDSLIMWGGGSVHLEVGASQGLKDSKAS